MPIVAADTGSSDYQQVPQGTHNAICYKIVDAGTTMNEFQGELKKQHSVWLFWELPDLRMDDDRPMSISHKYTLSLHERAALRNILQNWRNKPFTDKELEGFDITKILGVTCKVSVGLTSGGRDKVTGVFCADGGPKRVETENKAVIFDLDEYCKEWTGESTAESKAMCDILDELPAFMKWQIAGCDEVGKEPVPACFEVQAAKAKGGDKVVVNEPQEADPFEEDDIPF